jgi:ribonuclease P protein component
MTPIPTLSRQQDIDRVFEEGHWRRYQPVAVGTYQRHDDDPTRAAFVAGARIGTAVRRNRSRRRMREALRGFGDRLLPGADLVLAARASTADADFRALQAAIGSVLEAEGLLADTQTEGRRR